MRITPRRHNILIIFLSLALVPFIRLGEGDLRFDEVVYAARAQEVVAQGNLFPDVSLQHLYGRPPPLCIWAEALCMKLFGFSSFSMRLFSALSFSVLMIALYFLAGRMLSGRSAIGSVALLASSALLFEFAQKAQLDVPWLAVITMAFAAFVYAWDLEDRNLMLLSGALFGLSCITKLLISALPLAALFIWIFLQRQRDKKLRAKQSRTIAMFLAMIVIVALPWFIFMFARYGNDFVSMAFGFDVVDRTLNGADATVKLSGKLFNANALLVSFPICAIVAVGVAYRLREWVRTRTLPFLPWELFLWLWFAVPCVVLTIMRGELHSYAIQLLPPLAILACMYVDVLMPVNVSMRWRAAAILATLAACIWGSAQAVRDGAREMFGFVSAHALVSILPFYIASGLIVLFAAIIYFVARFKPRWLQRMLWLVPTYGAAALVLVRVADASLDTTTMRITGARTIAEALPAEGSVALLTARSPNADPEIQFECYDQSKTLFQRMIPVDRVAFAKTPIFFPDSVHTVVIVNPDLQSGDNSHRVAAANLQAQQFVLLIRTPMYELFRRGLLRSN